MVSEFDFLELVPKTWNDVKLAGNHLTPYSFRGQSNSNWPLETTIERIAKQFSVDTKNIGFHERRILDKFKSRAHHYIQSPPASDANVEWLSILQDYGGPTRLLDFTHSFYISAFFAIESATDDACIWAISEDDLMLRAAKSLSNYLESYERYELDPPKPFNDFAEQIITEHTKSVDFIVKIFPPRLNERLAAQKGVFLFNCNFENSFEYSLCKTFNLPFNNLDSENATQISTEEFLEIPKPRFNGKFVEIEQHSTKNESDHKINNQRKEASSQLFEGHFSVAPIIRIKLSKDIQNEALFDLDNMNINHASLFPGLEGFAKSMKLQFSGFLKDKARPIAFEFSFDETPDDLPKG